MEETIRKLAVIEPSQAPKIAQRTKSLANLLHAMWHRRAIDHNTVSYAQVRGEVNVDLLNIRGKMYQSIFLLSLFASSGIRVTSLVAMRIAAVSSVYVAT